jgi:signal transduction histidine kinase/CheY-like chemotaxis protein
MKKILHDPQYSDKILQMTADTMLLFNNEGICLDMVIHANQGIFKKRKSLIGENFFNLLSEDTRRPFKDEFDKVIKNKSVSTKNYELSFGREIYYFKCIMYPFEEDMVLCQYRDITKRTKIKLQLEKANNELREVEKAARICQWNYNFKTRSFNYRGFIGAMAKEDRLQTISIENYLELIFRDDRPNFIKWIDSIPNKTNTETFEYRILWKKEVFFLRMGLINGGLTDRNEQTIEGYCQNITDIIKLDESLENVTKAINYASEDIFAFRPDGTLIFANEQFRTHYLLTNQPDLSAININDLLVNKDLKKRWMNIRGEFVHINDIVRYVEKAPFTHLKEVLAFDFFSYIIRDSEGEDIIWTFGRDISEQMRYDAKIKEVNQIMNTVLENIPLAISVKDTGNGFRYIYRNSVTYASMKSTNVVGNTDFDIHPDDTAITFRNEDLGILKNGIPIIYDKEVSDNKGKKYIIHKQKFLAENGSRAPLIIALESDITKIKKMEEELVMAKEKAEKSDMLKSAFLANMSHEIRTPLNAIVGFSRVIADTQNANDRMEYYKIVEANNSRLLQLINEILDLSRIESGIMEFTEEPINLHVMCQEVFDAHRFRCSDNVRLIFEDSDPDLWIYSDKNRLIQVFSNLIGNALKFTAEGSIRFGYKLKDEFIECYVKDTGIGFPENKAKNVFERFAKLNTTAQGTGLGLSICKSIIEKLGGTIEAKSELGKGAEFTFTHPYISLIENDKSSPEEEETSTKDNELQLSDKKNHTILVAEDNDSNFKLLNVMIGKMFTLLHAHDGIEAITMFEEYKPSLILMDIKMPNMDGLDATRVIREVSSQIPIIALSAFVYNDDVKEALNCGCNEFIPKPVSLEVLTATLKKYL